MRTEEGTEHGKKDSAFGDAVQTGRMELMLPCMAFPCGICSGPSSHRCTRAERSRVARARIPEFAVTFCVPRYLLHVSIEHHHHVDH